MLAPNSKPGAPSAVVVACYNAVPSVLWSALALGPLVVYCYRYVERPWLWGFVAVSLSAYAWPAAWVRHLQLATSVRVYCRLGVPRVGYFTQQGALINRLLQRRYSGYRVLRGQRGLVGLLRTTYQQERFHWAGLLFFLLLSAYAAGTGRVGVGAGTQPAQRGL
ncbi:MAG: hypothetical protein ACRYFK_18405 [Janthinobacterium lividum]